VGEGGRNDPNNVYTYEYMNKEKKEKEWSKKENNGGDEPTWSIKHVLTEMSKLNPLYDYHILSKMFLK
jgi:hypothetical protein